MLHFVASARTSGAKSRTKCAIIMPTTPPDVPSPKLMDQVHGRLRVLHHALRTEQSYVDWILRFIRFHGKKRPAGMGAEETEAFLTHLTAEGKVAAARRNQAKSALLFLYRQMLGVELPWLNGITKAKVGFDDPAQRLRLIRAAP